MAKQKGIIKVKGTIGDMTFYKSQDGYIVKEKTSLEGSRIASDPAFQRTRENGSEFGRAGKAGKLLRNAVRNQMQNAKDNRVVSRLTKELLTVIKADATSTRGERNVIDGETEMMEGFEFNINAKLGTTLFAPYTATINRVTGEIGLHFASFIPVNMIAAPAGTTHFKIVTAGTEIDFENESFVSEAQETAMLELNATASPIIDLVNTVTPNSTHPLFALLGVQFFQEVNGIKYTLKNGAFNALAIVKVAGV
jgi:hypothetical protein